MCGAEAAGPCARCRNPTCGDCSVLTEGGTKLWAICLRCEKRGGKTLAPGWVIVAGWLLGVLLVISYVPDIPLALPRFFGYWAKRGDN